MGRGPGRILTTIEVDLPRPRTMEIRSSPEFQRYREQISALLFNTEPAGDRRAQGTFA